MGARVKQCVTACLLLLLAPQLVALEAISDEGLSGVTGQEGIILEIKVRNNFTEGNSPIACSGNLNNCRMGLEFSARDGIWLMLKEYYGNFHLKDLRIDIASLPASNTAYFDSDRFRDGSGTCLVAGCNPAGDTAVKFTYPGADGVGVYDDFYSFVNIGRAALEYDSGATPGYMRDAATGSVFGFRLSDSSAPNAQAQARFLGEAYVFGF